MDILLGTIAFIVILSLFFLLIYSIVKKKIWIIITIGMVVGITVGILILANSPDKPKIINKTSTEKSAIKKNSTNQNQQTYRTFFLPKGTKIINRDINGKVVRFKKGQRGYFFNKSLLQYTFVNEKISCWSTSKRIYISGKAKKAGTITLMASGGEDMYVKVKII